MTDNEKRLVLALRLLRVSAMTLQTSAELCVAHHQPIPENGNMPDWLHDSQLHIDNAGKLIVEFGGSI